MNTPVKREDESMMEVITGGSIAEGIGGIAAVVLAILGLAHVAPTLMLAVATLVVGAALLSQGATTAVEYSKLVERTGGDTWERSALGGGISTEIFAGVAGIVLGILSLLALDPTVLLPVAVIVFGGALLVSSGAIARLNALKIEISGVNDAARHVAREVMSAAGGAQFFIGLASIVLGILALIGLSPQILSLVALLVIGTSILLGGSAVSGKMLSFIHS